MNSGTLTDITISKAEFSALYEALKNEESVELSVVERPGEVRVIFFAVEKENGQVNKIKHTQYFLGETK